MKKSLHLFAALLFLIPISFKAQTCKDAAVELSAVAQKVNPRITLNWLSGTGVTSQYVYRKPKSSPNWSMLATLSPTLIQFVDSNVTVGVHYEYQVARFGATTAYGYINSGIEIPVVGNRGNLILIVDSTMIGPLSAELKRLMDDLEGDGWNVIRHDVLRTGTVNHVKSLIVADYNAAPSTTQAVFLFGHVPVPYSGIINPDGHPDHLGAWPADVYYADMNGTWTDVSVNNTSASRPENKNIPGDGKFDQSVIPTDVELQVGRVDLANLPTFTLTETQLLKNYLDKDHNYRKKVFTAQKLAVLSDNFGFFSGEAFAASGYKNFGPLVGPSNVSSANYFTTMTGGNIYKWSYGCGGGTYTSAGGIGNTANFAAANLQGVFTMLFGSYFGDWDAVDNFLRAPLAQGKILTNVWSGRPHWVFDHMGMGENIGYDARVTQNNSGTYFANYAARWVHVALMGDPTLRNDIVSPVSNVVATRVGPNCNISWSASTQTNVLGYNIYMKNAVNTTYSLINSSLITGTTYTDNCLIYPGIYKYMVRAVVLEVSPSGTYFNQSEGLADTAMNVNNFVVNITSSLVNATTSSVTCNTIANFTVASSTGTSYNWQFGDGGTGTGQFPVHTYTPMGTFIATVIASNSCHSDTAFLNVANNNFSVNITSASVSYTNSINTATFSCFSTNGTAYNWQFGDGGTGTGQFPAHTYTANGSYTATVIASNNCHSDTSAVNLMFDVGINELIFGNKNISLFPNPSNGKVTISLDQVLTGAMNLTVFNNEGKAVYHLDNFVNKKELDLTSLARGTYMVQITDRDKNTYSRKFTIE